MPTTPDTNKAGSAQTQMDEVMSDIQRTLVITTVFVTKGFAVKSNLLL